MQTAVLALVCVLSGVLTACGPADSPAQVRTGAARQVLTVFAAASTTDVVLELAQGYPGPRIRPSFGASSDLARQIRDGAPADVFLSASRPWAESLAEAGALEGEVVVFARNALVCVVPKGSELRARDLAQLHAALGRIDKVGIADEGVPAGEYTRESLAASGLLEAFRPHLVGQSDVRAVLTAVQRGECSAGFVYSTDTRAAAVTTLFALPEGTYTPIELFVCATRGSAMPGAAQDFIAYLLGAEGRSVLERAGFLPPGERGPR
jgi:molybdate transport system substrate-binding protein